MIDVKCLGRASMPTVVKDLLLSGHTLLDYEHMFDLNEKDLSKKIITLASGFDTFNLEMHQHGHEVISCARNYDLSLEKMRALVEKNLKRMSEHLDEHQSQFLIASPKEFNEVREKWVHSANAFLADYSQGKEEGRYRREVLPNLHFKDQELDLALSSHFLFAHTELSEEKHFLFIKEMVRVSKEVRIFPLSNAYGELSPTLGPVLLALQQNHFGVEVKQVEYEFLQGANAMLRVWPEACEVE